MLKAFLTTLGLSLNAPTPLPDEVNQLRQRFDQTPLTVSEGLNCAAYQHAVDLFNSGTCSHSGTDGSTFITRLKDCNTSASFEILACGFNDAQEVMNAWLDDDTLKSLFLEDEALAVGSAHVGDVWVLVLKVM